MLHQIIQHLVYMVDFELLGRVLAPEARSAEQVLQQQARQAGLLASRCISATASKPASQL
jgi:hypothetical protein